MKKTYLPIIISIIFLVLCVGIAVWSFLPKEEPNLPFDKGEYWSADFDNPQCLKKTVINKKGLIASIHYYDLHPLYSDETPGEFKREIFYYEEDKLTHSITYEYNASTATRGGAKYETRYVYEEERIVGAEVFTPRGTPTLSYDEYEYTKNGNLKTVLRYEYGELEMTYHFNGKKLPEFVDVGDLSYALVYDENGNLLSAKEKNGIAESNTYSITYEGKSPTQFVFDYYTYDYDHGYGIERFEMTFRFDQKGLLTEHCGKVFTRNKNGAVTFVRSIYEGKTMKTIEITYDKKGRLTERFQTNYYYDDNETTPFDTYVVSKRIHGYDEEGNMLGYTSTHGEQSTDYLYEYDKDGHLIKSTKKGLTSDYEDVTEYEYEFYPSGRLKKKTYLSNKGKLCGNEYAENGNVTIKYSYGNVTEYLSYDVAYPFSRMESVKKSAKAKYQIYQKNRTDYEYDENNRLLGWVTIYNTGAREVTECYENEQPKTVTEYDKDGNVTSVTHYTEDGQKIK